MLTPTSIHAFALGNCETGPQRRGNAGVGAAVQNVARIGLAVMAILGSAVSSFAADRPAKKETFSIRFKTERAGPVFINLYRPDGTLLKPLVTGDKMPAGLHSVSWDGLDAEGQAAPPGDYTWRGLSHQGLGLKLRGWAGNGGTTPWTTPDGKGGWGGDTGVPSAVAADAQRVYLGWSMADQGKAILACDLQGRVLWGHRRFENPSGCKALAVDDGVLYVLGGSGEDAEGRAIYKLDAKTGKQIPWPDGKLDLYMAPMWPADSVERPTKADGMAVRHGYIYLTFTSSQFMTMLEAKTGKYLQTVVGGAPGLIDVAPTKTDLPDAPGKLVDADFAVISLPGGVLGKVLFAHDPPWVVMSDLSPLDRDLRITALTVVGDGAKSRRHTAFLGLGAPFYQVQGRPLLDAENPSWVAGQLGGRPLLGPWLSDAVRAVRGVAFAADGKLWVAEGDSFPKRFSVWDTEGQQGKLVKEYFGPAESPATGGAINPLDPDLMFADGCEWRIDRKTGQAQCLGVVFREKGVTVRYGLGENGHVYLITQLRQPAGVSIYERLGDGNYKLRTRIHNEESVDNKTLQDFGERNFRTIVWADQNDDGEEQNDERSEFPGSAYFYPEWVTLDLTLFRSGIGELNKSSLLRVDSWTACGAPRYDLTKGTPLVMKARPGINTNWLLPRTMAISPDGRLGLAEMATDVIACQDVLVGKILWSRAFPPGERLTDRMTVASVRLAAPVNNLWIVGSAGGRWRLFNEDGFEIGSFFEPDSAKAQWPKVATPGVEMSRVGLGLKAAANATQGADGHLYLQTGQSAYWNLEVTGLDKVQKMEGGKLTLPEQ